MLSPPLLDKKSTSTNPTQEQLDKLGKFYFHYLAVQCQEWREAEVRIELGGLGWVYATRPGTAHARVSVPNGSMC